MGNLSQNELTVKVGDAISKVNIGDKYTHFKDPQNEYVIESIGIIENTEEVAVCYRALYGKKIAMDKIT